MFLFICCFSTTISESVKTLTLEEVRQQFLDYVNDYRNDRGLEELELRYTHIAQAHASDQAERDQYLAHRGFNQRADQIMDYLKQESELKNKAFGFLSVAENCCYFPICLDPATKAFQQFIASPTHRRNLLKHCEYTAIGIDQGKSGCFYFCQLFF
ncbi:MAG: hypothetical protein PWQ84_505 [Thermotogaceae bacterium]|jgi:uncharacterized protein YkwD|nr:hypothetical protein [Thermotogaceae bacterium]